MALVVADGSVDEYGDDLPKAYKLGSKRNSKGNTSHWIGYKLHIDQQILVLIQGEINHSSLN